MDPVCSAATDGLIDPVLLALISFPFRPKVSNLRRWAASYFSNGCGIDMKMHSAVTAETDGKSKHTSNTTHVKRKKHLPAPTATIAHGC
jgi:hypothetical protein